MRTDRVVAAEELKARTKHFAVKDRGGRNNVDQCSMINPTIGPIVDSPLGQDRACLNRGYFEIRSFLLSGAGVPPASTCSTTSAPQRGMALALSSWSGDQLLSARARGHRAAIQAELSCWRSSSCLRWSYGWPSLRRVQHGALAACARQDDGTPADVSSRGRSEALNRRRG